MDGVGRADWLPVEPVEEFLEYLRGAQRRSPNRVRNYAHGPAHWWQYLGPDGVGWDAVSIERLAGFLVCLRSGGTSSLVSIVEPPARLSEATIALRLAAVMAFYRYHQLNGAAGANTSASRRPTKTSAAPTASHASRAPQRLDQHQMHAGLGADGLHAYHRGPHVDGRPRGLHGWRDRPQPGTSGANGACLDSCWVADKALRVRPWNAPWNTTTWPHSAPCC